MPTNPPKLDLKAIKARCDAATEGPWKLDSKMDIIGPFTKARCLLFSANTDQDAAFVAASRTDLPALVEWVERAKEKIEDYCDMCGCTDALNKAPCLECREAEKLLGQLEGETE